MYEYMKTMISAIKLWVEQRIKDSLSSIDKKFEDVNQNFKNCISDWDQNDESALGYVKNRTHYDGRYLVPTPEVTFNGTAGTWGYVKVADSIDFDFLKAKSITIATNTGYDLTNAPVTIKYYYDVPWVVTQNDYWPAFYIATQEEADIFFDGESNSGAGFYFYIWADEGDTVSVYYSFSYEAGEVVQINPMYIKDMYYDIPYIENTIPETTITISNDNGYKFVGSYAYFITGETYTVVCNGVEYSCVAWEDGDGEVYLGNGDIYGGGPSNGEPFSLESYDDYEVYLNIETAGTYTISVSRNARDLKQIDKKYIPTPDWNQNDINGDGYIENRTHWAEKVKQEQTLVDNVTLNYSGTTLIEGPFVLNLIEDEIYTVVWDGVEYECKASYMNLSLYGDVLSLKDDEAFSIYVPLDGSEIKVGDNAETYGNHTISIRGLSEVEIVHKIDPKYLPNDIGGVTSWNDLTDKPFGEELEETVLFEKTLSPLSGWNNESHTSDKVPFVLDNTYSVIVNGERYDGLVAKEVPVENESSVGIQFDNWQEGVGGLYFKFANIPELYYGEWGEETANGGTHMEIRHQDGSWNNIVNSFDVQILGQGEIIYKIDPKYLPNDIGSINADWTETDENSKSFILNRPDWINSDTKPTYTADEVGATIIQPDKTSNMTQAIGKDENGLLYASNIFNGIVLKDSVNGYEYVGEMRNGTFVTYCKCDHIEVTEMPTKTEYYTGEVFDNTGMVVVAVTQDGSSREIENYTCVMQFENSLVEVQYVESGIIYSTTIDISAIEFNPSVDLQDFNYTKNEDGTYTLTGWKGTYNGVSSTKMVIPDFSIVNV